MAFQQKENTGALFINNRKRKPSDPDRTGTLNVGGTEYRISGWLNKTKKGETYMRLALGLGREGEARPQEEENDTW